MEKSECQCNLPHPFTDEQREFLHRYENGPLRWEAKVVATVADGLCVDFNSIGAFLPTDQIDLLPAENLEAYIGRSFLVQLTMYNFTNRAVVVSRRIILEEERDHEIEALKTRLVVGARHTGVIDTISEYGVWIRIGKHLRGLLYLSKTSKPVSKFNSFIGQLLKIVGVGKTPAEVSYLELVVGNEIDVEIAEYEEKGLLFLSLPKKI